VYSQPNDLLVRAKAGEALARNELIDSFRPFILKVAARFCKRRLDWRNDEELSVAMMAFNEAIDTFDPGQGAAWSSYAYLVINRRLTDYVRKENKYKNSAVLQEDFSEFVPAAATAYVGQDFERIFWQDEIHSMLDKLTAYGISMKDLVSATPKHKRVRLKLAYIAHQMSIDEYFLGYIKKNFRLPVKEISLRFNVRRKFVETWRRYLLALFLVLTDEDLIMVREYVGSLVEEGISEHANN
jgi:RNA polymerase sigma factor